MTAYSGFDFHDADGIDSGAKAFESRPTIFVSEDGLFCVEHGADVARNEDGTVTCKTCNVTETPTIWTWQYAANAIHFQF